MKKYRLGSILAFVSVLNISAQIAVVDSTLSAQLRLDRFERRTRNTYNSIRNIETTFALGNILYSGIDVMNNNTRFNKTNLLFNATMLTFNAFEFNKLKKKEISDDSIIDRRDVYSNKMIGRAEKMGIVVAVGVFIFAPKGGSSPFLATKEQNEVAGIFYSLLYNGVSYGLLNLTGNLIENSFNDNVQPIIQNNQLGLSIRF